jgi:hypothetical protein
MITTTEPFSGPPTSTVAGTPSTVSIVEGIAPR